MAAESWKSSKISPGKVFVGESAPLHAELLHVETMLAVLGLGKQRLDVGVVLQVHVDRLVLRDDAHVQHAIHLRVVRVEVDVRTVGVQVEEQVRLVAQEALGRRGVKDLP